VRRVLRNLEDTFGRAQDWIGCGGRLSVPWGMAGAPHRTSGDVESSDGFRPGAPLKAVTHRPGPPARKTPAEGRQGSDTTFQFLFASNPLPLWVYDLATLRFLDVNDVACNKYGYTREEFLALTIRDIRPAEDIPQVDVSVRTTPSQALSSGIWRHRTKDGTIIRVEILSHEIDYIGRRARFVCPIDVTNRMLAEEARAQLAKALQEREEGLRHAQRMAKLAHVVTRPDGSFESWSDTLPQLIGVDDDAMPRTTRAWLDLLHPSDRALFRAKALEAGATGRRTDVEYRVLRGDGTWIHLRQGVEPIPGPVAPGGKLRWFSTLQDVTDQKRAEISIRRLNRVYAVLSGINTLIVRVKDRRELYRETCRIAVEAGEFQMAWLGIVDMEARRIAPVASHGAGADYLAMMPLELDDALPEARGLAAQVVRDRKAVIVEDMTRDSRVLLQEEARQRGFHSLVILPLLISGEVVGVLALYAAEIGFFDAAEMKLLLELAGDIAFALDHIAKEEKLDYLSFYDTLTGLPNRKLFQDRLTQYLDVAGRERRQVAVILLDIERFHSINDTLGRQKGDELLKQVTVRCSTLASDPNLLARLVGDQFAFLIPDVKVEDNVARMVEQWNREIFGASYQAGDVEITLSAKFGIAVFPVDAADAESLMKNAEAALNRAKTTGERYLFYTQEMTERVAGHLTLENKLRHALERSEFVLHYQPKVDVETRRIVGVEALMRWQSPELGLVQPGQFIPLLEETGMILDVGAWALRQAVLDYRRWRERFVPPPIAVNVSAIQLRHRDFITIIRDAIGNEPAPSIGIEITESVIMEDIEATVAKLTLARDMGLEIAIDDFGTGYSSMAYLAKLPVHSLKIDRSFIVALADDPNITTMVSTIISLAHSLRLKVVAEGVETEEQAKILRLLRCDEMQGYLISRPIAEVDLQLVLEGEMQRNGPASRSPHQQP
jgi:diguanylate cyclase (GGDEF)-like protein/PAS domain S-box-containing protein